MNAIRKLLTTVGLMLLSIVGNGAVLSVGDERFVPKESGETMSFVHCNASATYNKGSGFVLNFWGESEIVSTVSRSVGAIYCSSGDLKISMAYGSRVKIKCPNQLGGIYVSFGALEITGMGTLEVIDGGIRSSGDMKLFGTAVTVSLSGKASPCLSAPDIAIEVSLVSLSGDRTLIFADRGLKMTGSMVNLVQGATSGGSDDAVVSVGENSKDIEIVGCVLSLVAFQEESCAFSCLGRILVGDSCVTVVSKGTCFSAWYEVAFQNARVLAVSRSKSVAHLYRFEMPPRELNGRVPQVFVGDGHYVFASGVGRCGVTCSKLEIDDGKVECCAPGAAAMRCHDFLMKDGSLKMTDKVHYRNCYQEVLSEAAIEAVVLGAGFFRDWSGLHTSMLNSMVLKLSATALDDPSGRADAAIYGDTFVQSGGRIEQGNSVSGFMGTRLWTTSSSVDKTKIPAFVGGSFNGVFQTSGKKDGKQYDYYDIAPTNALGQVLTHVSYEPYWIYRPSGGVGSHALITFEPLYGSVSPSKRYYPIGARYGDLPSATRSGYEFAGWYTSARGGTSVGTSSIVPSVDTTLYAHWTPTTVTVAFDGNGGTASVSSKSYAIGAAYGTLPTATLSGYTFDGWYTAASGGTKVTASTVASSSVTRLYAHWTKNVTYVTVMFDANGGSVSETSRLCEAGKAIGTLPTPSCSGYTFDGWYTAASGGTRVTASTVASSSVTRLYAHWTKNVTYVTVTFDANSGFVSETSRRCEVGKAIGALPTPTRNGYTFAGWYTSPTGGTKIEKTTRIPDEDTTYYAHWTPIAPGNDNFSNATALNGSSGNVTASNVGATSQSGEPLLTRWPDATSTIWWMWTAPSNGKVRFDTVGSSLATGTPLDTVMGVYTGSSLSSLTKAAPEDDDTGGDRASLCEFNSTAGTCYYIAVAGYGGKTGAVSLRWTFVASATVSVVFDGNGGTPSFSSYTYEVGAAYGTLPTATHSGNYTFDGWYTAANGGTEVTAFSTVLPSVTRLYAHWDWYVPYMPIVIGAQYRISFLHGPYGTGDDWIADYSSGSTISLKGAIFTRGGYVQTGWSKHEDGSTKDYELGATFTVSDGMVFYPYWTIAGPANDAFANATALSGTSGSVTASNVGATAENGEPMGRGAHTSTVWWKWTAPSTGRVRFDTIGSTFDTVMGVYTGSSLSSLAQAAPVDDDGGGNGASKCEFDCISGMQYCIVVAGYYGKTGTISLQWSLTPAVAVAFDGNEGTASVLSQTYLAGKTYGTLPTATRTGYAFDGWYTAPSGGTKVTTSTVVSASVTRLYAHWARQSFTVVFDLQGCVTRTGGGALTQTVEYGGAATAPMVTPNAGYVFNGWDTDFTCITAAKSVRASYSLIQYAISYSNLQGASNPNPRTYTVRSSVTLRPLADSADYLFVGWTPSTSISVGSTGDRAYAAQWRKKEFVTVGFDANGGELSVSSNRYVIGCAYAALPTPVLRGYEFCGWYTQATGGSRVTDANMASKSVTKLFAQWKVIEYSLRFEPNGGYFSAYTVQSFTYDVPTNLLANVYRARGKKFIGWSLSPTGTVDYVDKQLVCNLLFDERESGCQLYAVWEDLPTFDVVYLPGRDGIGNVEQDLKYAGEEIPLSGAIFTRPGYEQVGWSLTDGGDQAYELGARYEADESLVLYPVWKVNHYVVRYHPNWGQGVMEDQSFVYEVAQNLFTNSFTRGDSTFLGWSLSPTGDVVYADGACVSNVSPKADGIATLYAVWRNLSGEDPAEGMDTYMVIDLSGGSETNTYPVEYLGAVPSGGWTDEHKTTKLVLRKVPAGSFKMGSPTGECGRSPNEDRHQVTLTEPYYVGVFEVTRRQWELVMGADSPCAPEDAMKPAEDVRYYQIRGTDAGRLYRALNPTICEDFSWPETSAVNAESFMGRIRQRTGMPTFDLPTEAEWEYACRAGKATALNNGKNLDSSPCVVTDETLENAHASSVAVYALVPSLFLGEDAAASNVGTLAPNAWGLYDMHGNVPEWCLDFYAESLGKLAVTNPVGPSWGEKRVCRGGGWSDGFRECRSASRTGRDATGDALSPMAYFGPEAGEGFRLALRSLPDWKADFTVVFDVKDGELPVTEMTFVAGRPYGTLPVPERAGYDFAGWFTEADGGEQVTAETIARGAFPTLHARWTIRSYAVRFDFGGHAVRTGGGELVQVVEHGADAIEPAFTVNHGWIFRGWSIPFVKVEGELVVEALWDRESYEVRYEPGVNGVGTGMTFVAQYGDRVPIGECAYTCPGYVQTGWTTADGGETTHEPGATNVIDGPLTLYPTWRLADEALRGKFVVVDLSGGADAESYPVSRLDDAPATSWSNTDKTTRLVLRRIEAGTFRMGSPDGEYAHQDDENIHGAEVTEPFFIGIFEFTQRQWELVMGDRPSIFSNPSCYSARPVECVSCDRVRECLEVLSRKTGGLLFGLPREVEWEYACRAGTTTSLNSGHEVAELVPAGVFLPRNDYASVVARYRENGGREGWENWTIGLSGGTAAVGSYKANDWGLYDMHGNVEEWCADQYDRYKYWYQYTRNANVVRGGSWRSDIDGIRSAARNGCETSYGYETCGFRAVLRSVARTDPVRISLDCGGGTVFGAHKLCLAGEAYGRLPEPTKEGFVFQGWYTRPESGTRILPTDRVTADVTTLYAHWDVLRFQVTFDLGEHGSRVGGGKCSQTVELGGSATEPTVAADAGYRFMGWSAVFSDVREDLVVTARYGLDAYCIAYADTRGCANANPTSYTVDDAVSFSALTNPPGLKFIGWTPKEIVRGTVGDLVVTATWERVTCGVAISGSEPVTCEYGDVVTLSTFAGITNGWTNIVCTGWTGTGDVPASGDGTQVTFKASQPTTIMWRYETNYWFEARTSGVGSVLVPELGLSVNPTGAWMSAGGHVVVEAVGDMELFRGWEDGLTGLMMSNEKTLNVSMDAARMVVAVFGGCAKLFSPVADNTSVEEGEAIQIAVCGGSNKSETSVRLFLSCLTAGLADIDLKTATVDGATPKGGVKFPLTLSWAKGEVTNRVIRIPVKTDKTVEDDETLVFQLAAAQGQALGETSECKVTIRDANVASDYAEKQAKTTTKTKKGVADNYGLNIACVAGDGSGEICGYTSGQGMYYKGCKASLKATARPGWEFKGWGEVVGGATNVVSEKASWNVTLTNEAEIVAIFGRIPYVAGLADPADGGKVTGSGYCAAGKKVTLKATANKGYVFNGWYEGDALVSRLASYVLTMPSEDVAYEARFVTAEEDKASIEAGVNGMVLSGTSGGTPLPHCETNVMCGVYLEWPVAASALSATTVKVAGLPSGLKFTAKPITTKVTSGTGAAKVTTIVTNVPANTIYGAPSAASKSDKNGNVTPSKVKVTVTTAGKSKAVYEIALTVDPLPALAAGEFSGLALTKIRKDGIVTTTRWGSASLTVGSAGKMSGKMIVNGTNCTFTAASYDSFRKGTTEDDWQATATCSLKIGKQVVPMGLTVVAGGASVEEDDLTAGLFRNSWKDKGADPVPEEYQGTYSVKLASDRFRTGYLSLTVDKKGAVKVAGKAPDGTALSATATLVPAVDPEGAAYYFADVFCAPSAYKGGYVAGTVNFLADRTLSGYVGWRSYNPQSTGDYEKGGFDRALDCSGAKYDKNALLPDLGYGTLRLSALGVGEELFITVDKTGKKFVVVNKGDAKLTFSFTQSTGIWKGSYLMWPDPSSTKSVKVSFEGIMVQGEDLKGFGTYDATSSYPTYNKKGEQTGKKSYKYKESVPVDFIDLNNDI